MEAGAVEAAADAEVAGAEEALVDVAAAEVGAVVERSAPQVRDKGPLVNAAEL